MNLKIFKGKNPNVKKIVFTKKDAVYESVIYKYPTYKERTVICCSVMSGCPVGCVFCGTGKRFIRNLTCEEICEQIIKVLEHENISNLAFDNKINKFQIMFMSMGEPMLNWAETRKAIIKLHKLYPEAQLLLSTVGINDVEILDDICLLARNINKVGLQFSLHNSIDEERNKLIPFKNKIDIRGIRNMCRRFKMVTGRNAFINYCVTKNNSSDYHINRILDLFCPWDVSITFSTVCNIEKKSDKDETDYTALYKMQSIFIDNGFNVRVFDPAGKDDIGGGCGQLWYVQEWLKNHNIEQKEDL